MFLNGLQLRVISPLVFQLFGFVQRCSIRVKQARRHEADAFFRNAQRTAGHSLCAATHLLSLGIGKHS